MNFQPTTIIYSFNLDFFPSNALPFLSDKERNNNNNNK